MNTQQRRSAAPRPAKLCGSYYPGHTVHPIQAGKAAADGTGRQPGQVIETGESWLLVRFDDGTYRRYGNHDIPRLEQLLEQHGTRIQVQERWAVIWLGSHLISISRKQPL
jgi:hypothetical protein